MSASRAEGEADIVSWTSLLLAELLRDEGGEARVVRVLPKVFPWTRFLPAAGKREFLDDFVETARACVDVGEFYPLEVEIAAWRHTAETYADPELAEVFTRSYSEEDDCGPVLPPEPDS